MASQKCRFNRTNTEKLTFTIFPSEDLFLEKVIQTFHDQLLLHFRLAKC